MNDERIHKHDWEQGRCKLCGEEQVLKEQGQKVFVENNPVTSDQAEQIIKLLREIEASCFWVFLASVIMVWLTAWLFIFALMRTRS